MKRKSSNEIIDWCGVVLVVVAYALMSFNIFSSHSILYQSLNILGATAIAFSSFRKKDYEPCVLNVIWAVIALMAIINILK